MSRPNIDSGRANNFQLINFTLGQETRALLSNYVVDVDDPITILFDPNGADRDVTLPQNAKGLYFWISNVGTANNLLVKDSGGTLVVSLGPMEHCLFLSSATSWVSIGHVFRASGIGHSTGLVPDPGAVAGATRFLREDGQWASVFVVGIVDAFKFITDGVNTATASGPDTLKIRGSDSTITVTVTNNDVTHGDNINLVVNEAFVDHNVLLNYVADQHVAHTGVVLTAGAGLSGGGDISVSRTFDLDLNDLTADAPVLADTFAFFDISGGDTNKATLTTLNSILDHNSLLNYVGNQHIDHTTVSISAGTGLTGGGTIAASRTISLDINGLTTDTPASADFLAFYDASGVDHNKATISTIFGVMVPGADTQIIFNDAGTFGADAGLTYNKTTDTLALVTAGSKLSFNSGAAIISEASGQLTYSSDGAVTATTFTVRNTSASDVGAALTLFADSASPAANDIIGQVNFRGRDSGGVEQVYGTIYSTVTNTTVGSETAQTTISAIASGVVIAATLFGTVSAWAPNVNDGLSLGTSGASWSDVFLASGGVINWNNGAETLRQIGAGEIEFDSTTNGANFRVGAPTSTSGIFKQITLLGSDTGAGAGCFIQGDVGNPGTFAWGLGNRSSALGGAYSRQTLLSARDGLDIGIGEPGVSFTTYLTLQTTALVPYSTDGLSLGSSSNMWSDLFLASGAVINWNNGDVTLTHAANGLTWAGASNGYLFDAAVAPSSNDGAALGTSSLKWSDLFLADGGVINWNSSQFTLTPVVANKLQVTSDHANGVVLQIQNNNAGSQGSYLGLHHESASPAVADTIGQISFSGNNSTPAFKIYAQIATLIIDPTATSEDGALDFTVIGGGALTNSMRLSSSALGPVTNDTLGLGIAGAAWSDLYLASGAVINFNSSDVTITHGSDVLTIAGGSLKLAAGTTGIAPAQFQSGTNLTTAAAGALEYDGSVFYATPVASNRAVAEATHFLSLSANQTGSNVNTAQTWFPGGGSTGLNVAASTSYFFEGVLAMSRSAGTTSHTIGVGFGGTATITSIAYNSITQAADQAAFPITSSFSAWENFIETATNTTAWPNASTSANEVFVTRVHGIVRVNAAGTFIPQFTYSAAPGGAPTIRANTWFTMTPIGTNSVLSVGNWQ